MRTYPPPNLTDSYWGGTLHPNISVYLWLVHRPVREISHSVPYSPLGFPQRFPVQVLARVWTTDDLRVPKWWCSRHVLRQPKAPALSLRWLNQLSQEKLRSCCATQGKPFYHCLRKNGTPVNIHCYSEGGLVFVTSVQRTHPFHWAKHTSESILPQRTHSCKSQD